MSHHSIAPLCNGNVTVAFSDTEMNRSNESHGNDTDGVGLSRVAEGETEMMRELFYDTETKRLG